jgi:hypothetical protein
MLIIAFLGMFAGMGRRDFAKFSYFLENAVIKSLMA